MSFGVPGRNGQPRQPGGEFFSGTMSGPVLREGQQGSEWRDGGVIGTMGEGRIAQSERIRRQPVERIFQGAPKFWRVTNRAKLGHVQVWASSFNGETYPEGATDDKRTWLKPGESMMVTIEAGLHFFGNVFDPRAPEAIEIIERTGGFELETQKSNPGKNAEVRVIGGPVGLPDFIIEPIDGRMRAVGGHVEIYPLYWNAVKRRVLKTRKDRDPDVIEAEKTLLAERIAEYRLEEEPDYDAGTILDGNGRVLSTAESRAEADGTPDMREVAQLSDEDRAELEAEPEVEEPPARGRRRAAAAAGT
jgi:hypothetical protein